MLGRHLDENALAELRRLLFPAMGLGIFTGFNAYQIQPPASGEYVVSYLHNALKQGENHGDELREILEMHGFETKAGTSLSFSRVDRVASYRLRAGWTAEHYFLPNLKELSKEEAKEEIRNKQPVIGLEKQDDLRISLDREKDLAHLLELLRIYTYLNAVDKNGELIFVDNKSVQNPFALADSWEVPVHTVYAEVEFSNSAFEPVNKVYLGGYEGEVSMIVKKRFTKSETGPNGLVIPSVVDWLRYKKISWDAEERCVYANKPFAAEIDSVDWDVVQNAMRFLEPGAPETRA